METTNLKKKNLLIIKAHIKGLAEEGQRCWQFINASSKDRRSKHWDIKRELGVEARYYLIAYGLLRGVSYNKIEPNSNKDKLNYYFNYEYLAQICQRNCPYKDMSKWTPAYLQRLINDEVEK